MKQSDFIAAARATIPVLFGYIPLGIAFGLLFIKAGAPWYIPPLMSLLVFAGAAQFIAISVLSVQGSLWTLMLSTLLVNLRHLFYGISFVGKFPNNLIKKNYMIFGLTDEAYSILTSTSGDKSQGFCFWVIAISHFYWLIGTLLGVLLGKLLHMDLSFLKFSLTALFIVLTIEQAALMKKTYPFIIAIISAVVALIYFPHEMLLCAIGMATVLLLVVYLLRSKL